MIGVVCFLLADPMVEEGRGGTGSPAKHTLPVGPMPFIFIQFSRENLTK